MAAKRFKLKFSLPSFQFCRFKQPRSFPKSPSPAATYLFSPINPKSFEISYPNFPEPPPSTPNHSSSKFIKLNSQKIYNSPISFDTDTKSPSSPPKKEKQRTHNSKSKVFASISSADSVWFSSEDEEETESLFSSSRSFDSSLEMIDESSTNKVKRDRNKNKKKNGNIRVRRLKRYVSKTGPLSESESDCTAKKSSVLRRLMPPCAAAEGKVKDSFAVVKRSEDPYEDFKRSMLEMILEKQMFEAEDLEQLLQCFLSLNSRQHHAVIVQAFTEIWEDLFL